MLVENIKGGKVYSLIGRLYHKNSAHRVVSARRQNCSPFKMAFASFSVVQRTSL